MVIRPSQLEWSNLRRWNAIAIPVAVEEHAFAKTLSTFGRLDPLASSSTRPQSLEETPGTAFDVGAVVATQYRLDSFGSFVGVVERDGGDKMVKDVRLYNSVHKGPTNKAEIPVNGCSSAPSKVPGCVLVMREGRISMLKIGDCD